MSLSYEKSDVFKILSPLFEEHSGWYSRIIKFIFYPDKNRNFTLEMPKSFGEFLKKQEEEDYPIDPITLNRLVSIQSELHSSSKKVVELTKSWGEQKIPYEEFNNFSNLYDEFINHIRRIEEDIVAMDKGLDSKTGLRSVSMLESDMAKELERRARNGKTFSIVLARLDNFDEIKEKGEQFYDKVLKISSASILECIRSFDDAYRLNETDFLLSLKHANVDGAVACTDRLRDIMNRRKKEEGLTSDEDFTLSQCVGEPLPGYNIPEMIDGMREDMKENITEPDSVIKYVEQSPLQRYLKSVEST